MKTTKLIFCAAMLFSSCLSVDHEISRYNAEGMAYFYGNHFVDQTRYKFKYFYEDGDQDESYKFEQLSDSTWKIIYNNDGLVITGLYVKPADNSTSTLSFEGYDLSDDYSLHIFTPDSIIGRGLYSNISGTVRVEISQNNQLIGWGQLVYKDEYYIITTGTE